MKSQITAVPSQGGGPRRSVASLTGTHSWSDRAARFTASVRVQDGTVVLLLDGRFDGATLRTCHLALAAALRVRTREVIVDLSRARLDHRSIEPIVQLIRSASRFGVVLLVRDLPVRLRSDLARAAPASHYALVPAVAGRSPRLPDPVSSYSDLVVVEARPRR